MSDIEQRVAAVEHRLMGERIASACEAGGHHACRNRSAARLAALAADGLTIVTVDSLAEALKAAMPTGEYYTAEHGNTGPRQAAAAIIKALKERNDV